MWAVAWNVQCGMLRAMWNEVGYGIWHGMCNVVWCGMLCDVE